MEMMLHVTVVMVIVVVIRLEESPIEGVDQLVPNDVVSRHVSFARESNSLFPQHLPSMTAVFLTYRPIELCSKGGIQNNVVIIARLALFSIDTPGRAHDDEDVTFPWSTITCLDEFYPLTLQGPGSYYRLCD